MALRILSNLTSTNRRTVTSVAAVVVLLAAAAGAAHLHHGSSAGARNAVSAPTAVGTVRPAGQQQTPAAGSKLNTIADKPAATGGQTSTAPAAPAAPAVAADGMAVGLYSGSVSPGSNFTVRVYENSGATAVNSVQVKLTYDPSQLEIVGTGLAGPFGIAAATDTRTAGIVRIARADGDAPVTGIQPVTDMTFKVKAGVSGSVALQLDSAGSLLVGASNPVNILATVSGAHFTVGSN